MFYLFWDAKDFGLSMFIKEVKAPYNSLEEAMMQATHDLTLPNPKSVLRIEDETGKVVWNAPSQIPISQ